MSNVRHYIMPDTNYLLHGKPLHELTPALLEINQEPTWVFAGTVIDELDEKAHLNNARIKRRARSYQKRIAAAIRNPTPSAIVYSPQQVPDYRSLNLNPLDADDRIVGDALAFAQAHPKDTLQLLTLDTGMLLRAYKHGVAVVRDAERFGIIDEDDPTEKALKAAQAELHALKRSQPEITLTVTEPNVARIVVAPPIPDAAIDEIVERAAAPEVDTGLTLPYSVGAYYTECENYGESLKRYAEEMGEFLRARAARWSIHALSLSIMTGAVAAQQVHIDLHAPPFARWLAALPQEPEAPQKPARYVFGGIAAEFSALFDTGASGSRTPSFQIPRFLPEQTSLKMQISERTISLWKIALPQRNEWKLPVVFLDVALPVPEKFEIQYEARMSTASMCKRAAFSCQLGSGRYEPASPS